MDGSHFQSEKVISIGPKLIFMQQRFIFITVMEMTFAVMGIIHYEKGHFLGLARKSHFISITVWRKLIMEMEMSFDHNGKDHFLKFISPMMTFP